MARTFPTAGIAPVDVYMVGPEDRNAGYFEHILKSSDNGVPVVSIKTTDARLAGTNYQTMGLKVEYLGTGIKSKYVWNVGIVATITAQMSGYSAIYINTTTSGNPTLNYLWGIYMDLNTPGTSTETVTGIRIRMNNTTTTSAGWFLAFRKLGSVAPTSIMMFEASAVATYFIYQAQATLPFIAGSHRTDTGDSIQCYFNGARYIALYT